MSSIEFTLVEIGGFTGEADCWPKAGDKMRFLGKNGYDFQLADAKKHFSEGQILTVVGCRVGAFDHTIKFEEEPKRWFNGVMFEPHSDATSHPERTAQ